VADDVQNFAVQCSCRGSGGWCNVAQLALLNRCKLQCVSTCGTALLLLCIALRAPSISYCVESINTEQRELVTVAVTCNCYERACVKRLSFTGDCMCDVLDQCLAVAASVTKLREHYAASTL
jgi:hypothetical protein